MITTINFSHLQVKNLGNGNPSEGVKKLNSSTFVLEGWVDFQSFRMRSLRLRVVCHSNKILCLSEVIASCFNFQRWRSKASPIHPSFRFDLLARFFHTFSVMGVKGWFPNSMIRQGCFQSFIKSIRPDHGRIVKILWGIIAIARKGALQGLPAQVDYAEGFPL